MGNRYHAFLKALCLAACICISHESQGECSSPYKSATGEWTAVSNLTEPKVTLFYNKEEVGILEFKLDHSNQTLEASKRALAWIKTFAPSLNDMEKIKEFFVYIRTHEPKMLDIKRSWTERSLNLASGTPRRWQVLLGKGQLLKIKGAKGSRTKGCSLQDTITVKLTPSKSAIQKAPVLIAALKNPNIFEEKCTLQHFKTFQDLASSNNAKEEEALTRLGLQTEFHLSDPRLNDSEKNLNKKFALNKLNESLDDPRLQDLGKICVGCFTQETTCTA